VWFDGIEIIKQFEIIDSEYEINELYSKGKTILAEGAQGTLLDVDFGSYPFVTSSNTICAGACTGMGIAPSTIGNVMGIVKAYCTRVGSGPFPTELNDEVGQNLRDIGREYGSTTGRPRRCGWLDLVALRYAVMLNGVTEIILTKADVLDTFETIKVATAYKVNGNETQRVPFDIDVPIEPIYTELKGWNTSIEQMRNSNQLPKELNDYIAFIEKEVGVPVSIVSVGPDREATIFRKKQ
jgi:adenylosuccinate synthase